MLYSQTLPRPNAIIKGQSSRLWCSDVSKLSSAAQYIIGSLQGATASRTCLKLKVYAGRLDKIHPREEGRGRGVFVADGTPALVLDYGLRRLLAACQLYGTK